MRRVLLLLSCIFALSWAAPIIQTQRVNYETLSAVRTSLLVSATFPEDVFVESKACGASNQVPAALKTCCTTSNKPGCFAVNPADFLPYPGIKCLDETNGGGNTITITEAETVKVQYFVVEVANPSQCNGIYAAFESSLGDVSVAAYVTGFKIVLPNRLAALSLCCEFLATGLQQAWDGRIIMEVTIRAYVTSPLPVPLQVSFHRAERLPLTLFNNLVEVNTYINSVASMILPAAQCDGSMFASHSTFSALFKQGCDWTLRPTPDPFHDFFSRGVRRTPSTLLRNTALWQLNIRTYDTASALSTTLIDPNDISRLRFEIRNVYSAATNSSASIGLITPSTMKLGCQHSKFEPKYNELQSRLNIGMPGISDNVVRGSDSFEELELRYFAALAPSLSLDWLGCDSFSRSLLKSSGTAKEFASSDCFAVPETPEYLNDPCCNTELLKTQCCAPRLIVSDVASLAASPEAIANAGCLADRCASDSAARFGAVAAASVSQLQQSCDWVDQLSEYRAQRDAQNLYQNCVSKLIGQDCRAPYQCPESECLPNPRAGYAEGIFYRTCSIPCETDSDCLLGECINNSGVKRCAQLSIGDREFLEGDLIKDLLIKCIAEGTTTLEPFFQYNILLALNLTKATATIPALETAWRHALADEQEETCTKPNYWDTSVYDETTCLSAESCNWFHCDPFTYSWCNPTGEYCLTPPFRGSDFCGRCDRDGTVCAEVSQENSCIYAETFGTFSESFVSYIDACTALNGVYDDLGYLCFRNASTHDTCLPPRFCPTTVPLSRVRVASTTSEPWQELEGDFCYSMCYSENITQTECTDGNWRWHTHPDGDYCEMPAISYERCLADYANQTSAWWPGASFLPEKLLSPAACTPKCSPDTSRITKSVCEEGFHCSNPLCVGCNEEQCLASGFCDTTPGCYLPHLTSDNSCAYSAEDIDRIGLAAGFMLIWKPDGCLLTYPAKMSPLINEYFCLSLNTTSFPTFFRSHDDWLAIDKATCESNQTFTSLCQEGNLRYLPETSTTSDSMPWEGVSFKDATTCTACSGFIRPAHKWVGGAWVKNTGRDWLNLRWMTRGPAQIYNMTTGLPNQQRFDSLFAAASAKREADIARFGLYCRFGQQMDSLQELTCLCADSAGRAASDCISSGNGNAGALGDQIAVDRVCSNLRFTYEHLQFGRIEIDSDFSLPNFGCMEVTVELLPLSKYNFNNRISLFYQTASTQTAARQFNTVKNIDNVVIGSIVSDGVALKFPEEQNNLWSGGLRVCFDLPETLTLTGTPDPAEYVDIAWTTREFDQLRPLGLRRAANTAQSICLSLAPGNQTVLLFPVGIIADSGRSYYSTFTVSEAGVLWFAIVCYAATMLVASILFSDHVRFRTWGTASLSFSSFVIIIIFLFNRSLYMAFLVSGVLAAREEVLVIFSELPSVLYLTVYTLFVFRQAEIYHFSLVRVQKRAVGVLKPLLIASNVVTYIVVIVMIVLYFVITEEPIPQTCLDDAIQSRALSAKEGVALAYFIIFVAVALAILLSFITYSARIFVAWRAGQQFRSKSHLDYNIIARLIGCAIVSGIGLILRVVSLLLPLAGIVLSPIGVVVYLLFSDLIPTVFLIIIFKRQSGLQASQSTGSSTSSRSNRFKSGSRSTAAHNYSTMAQYDPASVESVRDDL